MKCTLQNRASEERVLCEVASLSPDRKAGSGPESRLLSGKMVWEKKKLIKKEQVGVKRTIKTRAGKT